jgi:hypothetical protein
MAIEEIVCTSELPIMATFSFHENVEDMKQAKVRWRRLKERLRRRYPSIRMAGAWQRQTRGAWHYHGVVDRHLPVDWLREVAVACGFGQQMKLKSVMLPGEASRRSGRCDGGHNWSLARVCNYITRYVARDFLDESVDPGARVVDYFGDCRVCSTAFAWVAGFARLWRAGRAEWYQLYGEAPSWTAYHDVILLGWHFLSEDEQARALAESDSVFKWRCPELVPF